MKLDYYKLKHARFFYAFGMDLATQVSKVDKEIKAEKIYTVKIQGNYILGLLSIARRYYRETQGLQRAGY